GGGGNWPENGVDVCGLLRGGESEVVAEGGELVQGAALGAVAPAVVDVGGGELAVGGLTAEEVVGGRDDGVAGGDDRGLGAVADDDAAVQVGDVGLAGLLGPGGGVAGLRQRPAQVGAAAAPLAAEALAGALVVAGAHPGPGGQV